MEDDLVTIGALVPDDGMLRASPVLLSRLMVVLAKHLAAADRGIIPFTGLPSAHSVAFAPLGPDLAHRSCWQLQIGHLLPVPAPDAPLTKVLEFREAYADEREELAAAVRKLLLSASGPVNPPDLVSVQKDIKKGVQRLEKAGRSLGIVWLKRSLWVFAGIGTAAAGAYALPHYDWLSGTLSGLGINVATAITRPGVSTEFAYLQHLRSTFPEASWPTTMEPT